MNRDELFSDAYKKHLASDLRKAFGYEGCPIILVPKARPKTVAPIRKYDPERAKQEKSSGPRRPAVKPATKNLRTPRRGASAHRPDRLQR